MSQQISKQYFGFAPRESIDEKKREDYCIFFNAEGVYSALDKMMKIAHPRKNQPVFIKSKHDNKSWYPILEREGILLEEPSIKDDPEYQRHLEAVKKGGLALQYAPENLRDREMCLEAVKQNEFALKFVPEKFKDKNGKFIEKEEQSSDYVPEFNELLEAKVIDLVKNNSSMFLVISPMYKTAKVCTAFMNCKSQLDKGEKYELLPKQFQNKEFQTLCDLAQKFDLH